MFLQQYHPFYWDLHWWWVLSCYFAVAGLSLVSCRSSSGLCVWVCFVYACSSLEMEQHSEWDSLCPSNPLVPVCSHCCLSEWYLRALKSNQMTFFPLFKRAPSCVVKGNWKERLGPWPSQANLIGMQFTACMKQMTPFCLMAKYKSQTRQKFLVTQTTVEHLI